MQIIPLPPEMGQYGVLSISDPNGHLMLTVSGGEILDGDLQPIANQQSPAFYYSGSSNTFIPVPGHPERMFLFHYRHFGVDVRKHGWMEIGPDGEGGQMRVTDAGTIWFMLNPAAKSTGIAHANGEDYWFITQAAGTNEVHAFRIGDQGIEDEPVVSPGGVVIDYDHLYGFMVASVQGDRFISQTNNNAVLNEAFIELFGFDPATGQAVLQHTFAGLSGQYWGAEFSPSGRYVYILEQFGSHTIYQYDLQQADIEASRVVIDTHENFLGGSGYSINNIWLAPDGRIYINRAPTLALGIIQAPDEAAPNCAYTETVPLPDGCHMAVPHPLKHYHDDQGLPSGMGTIVQGGLQAWPNPMDGKGALAWNGSGPVHVQWSNAQGREIRRTQVTPAHGRIELDATELATGVYLLRVIPLHGDATAAMKIMVAH